MFSTNCFSESKGLLLLSSMLFAILAAKSMLFFNNVLSMFCRTSCTLFSCIKPTFPSTITIKYLCKLSISSCVRLVCFMVVHVEQTPFCVLRALCSTI